MNHGSVSRMIQASENSSSDSRDHRAEQPEPTGAGLLAAGSLEDRIEMKMMLSTPRTISRKVSVAKAIQI